MAPRDLTGAIEASRESRALELGDLQGLLRHAYAKQDHASYHALALRRSVSPVEARRALRSLLPLVRSADQGAAGRVLQMAFTVDGLAALGVDDDTRGTFPREARNGMHDLERSRVLGDLGPSSPETWEWGSRPCDAPGCLDEPGDCEGDRRVHVLLLAYADSLEDQAVLEHQIRHASSAFRVVGVERASRLPGRKEHFGFRDGLSQPAYAGLARDPDGSEPLLPTGELVLGYDNAYQNLPASPSVDPASDPDGLLPPSDTDPGRRDLGRNGTYLVFRKLEQDVFGFRRTLAEKASALAHLLPGDPAVTLAAKMIGRWPSGAPLALAPTDDAPALATRNDFDFSDDPHGLACPLGAHVRRTNPRASLGLGDPERSATAQRTTDAHRILRRGRPYGPPAGASPDGERRGLLFLCLGANLARGFEFVQQTWCENPKFHGLVSDPDPTIGSRAGGFATFSCPTPAGTLRVDGLPRFVTTRAGGYFFVPGLRALSWILRA